MKALLKGLVVLLALGATLWIVQTGLHLRALNLQAQHLVEKVENLTVGCGKAEVLAVMPNDLLVSMGPLTTDEAAETKTAVSALRYNAPVFLNSVYVLLLFDERDQLVVKRRFD